MNDGPEGRETSGDLGKKSNGKTARAKLSLEDRQEATRARKKEQREGARSQRQKRREKRLANKK